MRLIFCFMLLTLPVLAQEKNKPAHWGAGGQMPGKSTRPDAHQKMLDKFDTNKDGKLDAAEIKAMRTARQK